MRTRKANLRYRLTVLIVLAGLLTTPGVGAIHSILEPGQPVGPGPLISVNAASYADKVAPESIVAGFGANLATTTQSAQSQPLPITLGGTSIMVTDSAGIARFAPLLLVSPTQINYIMPPETSVGLATVDVILEGGGSVIASGSAQVTTVAPGIFTVSGAGSPPTAAGQWLRYSGGVLVDSGSLETPIVFGYPGDKVSLVLYGTDIRNRSSLSAVSATVGGSSAVVEYAGPQESLVGLDQISVIIPPTLAGKGQIKVVITVDGVVSNTVKVTAGK